MFVVNNFWSYWNTSVQLFFLDNFLNNWNTYSQFFLVIILVDVFLCLNSPPLTQEKRIERIKLLKEVEDLLEKPFYYDYIPESWDCKSLCVLISGVLLIVFLSFYFPKIFNWLYFMLMCLILQERLNYAFVWLWVKIFKDL
jgi:hypothetical protein